MTLFRRMSLAGAAGIAIATFQTAALAQSAGSKVTDNQEIIVTANKRQESVKDIPFTVNVIGEDALIKNRVQSIEDVARLTPGLEVGVGFGRQTSNTSIRGISPQNFGTATVLTFVDGFTSGLRNDVTSELFDLERVEVLKGPQSTLYGRNALGGLINYVTKKPSSDWEGRVQASYGNYNAYAVRAGISGPIAGETLTFRLSGSVTGRDGYFDNLFDGKKNVDGTSDRSVRLALRLAPPGSGFESNLSISYSKSSDDCGDCIQRIVGYNLANPSAVGQRLLDVNNTDRKINQDTLGFFKRPILTVIFNNEVDFGSVKLTSLSGFTQVKTDLLLDFGRNPGPLVINPFFNITNATSNIVDDVLSQEFRLSSEGNGPFQWIAGVYYYNQRDSNKGDLFTNFGPIPGNDIIQNRDNYAAFVSGSYKFGDQLTLGLGLRYDVETNDLRDLLLPGPTLKATSKVWLPSASLTYAVSDDANIYAKISRGYRSGGLNSASATFGPPPISSYAPEFIWNYEAGLKGGNRRFDYELSGYYMNWTAQQVTSSTGAGLTYITNAGRTRVYGAEARIGLQATDALRFDLGAAWTHSRYLDFNDQSGVPVFYGVSSQRAGQRTLLAPDFSGTAQAEYVQPLSGGWDLTARFGGRYTGKRTIDNASILVPGGYFTADGSLSIGRDKLRATVFANNLFDRNYATFAQLFGFSGLAPLLKAGAPRTFGIQLEAGF